MSGEFDLDGAWRLHPQVALRPEPFGALLYHFGTRRLSFLKAPYLRDVVAALGGHPSARAAIEAAGFEAEAEVEAGVEAGTGTAQIETRDARRSAIVPALSTLADTGMIVRSDR